MTPVILTGGAEAESSRDPISNDTMGAPHEFAAADTVAEQSGMAISRRRHSETAQPEKAGSVDIAVIGLAGRYPQARTMQQFWRNLSEGKDCISEIPEGRWDHSRYFDEDKSKPGKTYSKWGGFIDGVDQFDPLFFNISPREAELMDPQERLFLQCVFETLEDAGYTREAFAAHQASGLGGNVGVFVGVMYEEYQLYGAQEQALGRPTVLSGSPSSIANRVSYFCNFHGPSLAVDTMCSSSLTAIHLACESLQRGGCELAIAGGVNVSIHPNKYLILAQGRFISSKGRCESFGEGGDGYVPGEGVGAVLLKPLSKAVADGDQIYGIVKATAINHGGKANGYSAPNLNAQAKVIGHALKEAGIDPRMISYVEAHGTGTSLGDPIEIAGLSKAFQKYTQDKQFCAIGSVKSNIGHCESAAGIAGVTKVLLQLKHRKLVPSLHAEVLNRHINFSNTPFVVQRELTEWKRPVLPDQDREMPRIAGISSFGAGGANAHVVIEEYIASEETAFIPIVATTSSPAIIVLSAKNEERLHEQAQQLLAAIEEQPLGDADLADLAYTLQVGREAMEERLGLIVTSITAVQHKLAAFMAGENGVQGLYRGQVKRNQEVLAALRADDDMAQVIEAWISKGKISKVLGLWAKGLDIDWNKLYRAAKPRRISLPTYPFARERYWIPQGDVKASVNAAGSTAVLHPLLHRNTSDLSKQRFSSIFTGEEFFLSDHRVKEQRVLPGVAYLEMARAALCHATGSGGHASEQAIMLRNIVWIRPVIVDAQAVHVHIGLFPEANGEIAYEIYSGSEDQPKVHSQGIGSLRAIVKAPQLDMAALQSRCVQETESVAQYYARFSTMGLEYGAAHRAVAAIYRGSDSEGRTQVLARLELPAAVSASQGQYVLHPSIMDAALQAMLGLVMEESESVPQLALPFALQELEIYGACSARMWAVIGYSAGSSDKSAVRKLDIDVCNEQGMVCARLKGLSARLPEGDGHASTMPAAVEIDAPPSLLTLAPVWDVVSMQKDATVTSNTDAIAIVGGTPDEKNWIQGRYPHARTIDIDSLDNLEVMARKLLAFGAIDHLFWLAPAEQPMPEAVMNESLIAAQQHGVLPCFRLIKAVLQCGYGAKALRWTVITRQACLIRECDSLYPAHASVHGLIGSMAKEYPNWAVRLLDVEADSTFPLTEASMLPTDALGNAWAYRSGQWYRQQLISVSADASVSAQRSMYRANGVYVVIGGAGGIGEAWSESMIRRYQAQIIWIGRREENASIGMKLDRLAALGKRPFYIAADATERQALARAHEEIKQRYGHIHGVIHAAIVLSDKSLANMDQARFQTGLSAKVDVSVRLAQVFGKEQLDFILFFSSMQSFAKAPGQSNYAAGCTFKDAFARYLGQKESSAVKVMNWGYWGSVGVVASKEYQERMVQAGVGSIEPAEGMIALETLLTGPMDQLALFKTSGAVPILGTTLDMGQAVTIHAQEIPSIARRLQGGISPGAAPIDARQIGTGEQADALDTLSCKLLWAQLQSMGLFGGEALLPAQMKIVAALHGLYDRWLEASLSFLVDWEYIRKEGEMYVAVDPARVDLKVAWAEWEQHKTAWLADSHRKAQVVLVEVMLKALPQILTGQRSATDVMFPHASMQLVEGIYQRNPVSDYFNDVLANTVAAYLDDRLQREPASRIRILEIGAGTGGTSATIFNKLQPYRAHLEEYCYTDISTAFLQHAQQVYGPENPYLRYQRYNVEVPLAEQALRAGSYDLVIAANVLHATKNIRQTLRNAKAALKCNGMLLMNEISNRLLFTHLTFGLLEGWWLYEDAALRIPGCPGLYPEAWRSVLEAEGYRSVFFPAEKSHEYGQQVIVAESDGVVRQPRVFKVIPTPSTANDDAKVAHLPHPDNKTFIATIQISLVEVIADFLKMNRNDIDIDVDISEYGIDSLSSTQFTNALNQKYQLQLSPTVFFEHPTVRRFSEYLLAQHRNLFAEKLDAPVQADRPEPTGKEFMPPEIAANPGKRRSRFMEILPVSPTMKHAYECEPIAIIAMSGQFPMAADVSELWRNLAEGRDCITEIPEDRWDHRLYFDEDRSQRRKTYSKWGGFIPGVNRFDPAFFGISVKDAEMLHVKEHLFLQSVWNLFESAAYSQESLARLYESRVGVFVGAMSEPHDSSSPGKESPAAFFTNGSVANRVSHFFNLQGPSVSVDTMSSSAMTAVHMACEALRRGECKMAVAGGINLLSPEKYIGLSQVGILGSHAKSRSFADGDGFLPAECVGTVLLKPLSMAIQDNDIILAAIKSTSVSHAGRANRYTVANPVAQAQLIEDSLKRAGVHPRTISHVEAAANGSALGDSIEFSALTKIFRKFSSDNQFCSIGSVKSNIGHAEAASGISQLIKVVLQLKHAQLVPFIKSECTNPHVNFHETPFYLQEKTEHWKRPIAQIEGKSQEWPRRAMINSFGAGGAYVNVIVEEYSSAQNEMHCASLDGTSQIVLLSAADEQQLQIVARQMLDFLLRKDTLSIPNLAYTLQVGREALDSRLAIVVRNKDEMIDALRSYLKSENPKIENTSSSPIFVAHKDEFRRRLRALLDDESEERLLQPFLSGRNLEKLAMHWVNGRNVPWESLHQPNKVHRMSLPTYPFARANETRADEKI